MKESSITQPVKPDFLTSGQRYEATIYANSKGASWDKNPQAYQIRKQKVSSITTLKLRLAAGGGAAISFKPVGR